MCKKNTRISKHLSFFFLSTFISVQFLQKKAFLFVLQMTFGVEAKMKSTFEFNLPLTP